MVVIMLNIDDTKVLVLLVVVRHDDDDGDRDDIGDNANNYILFRY